MEIKGWVLQKTTKSGKRSIVWDTRWDGKITYRILADDEIDGAIRSAYSRNHAAKFWPIRATLTIEDGAQ